MKQFIYLFIFMLPMQSVFSQGLLPVDSLCKVQGKVLLGGKPVSANLYYSKLPEEDGIGVTRTDASTGFYNMLLQKGATYRIEVVESTSVAFKKVFEISLDDLKLDSLKRDISLNSNKKNSTSILDILFKEGKNTLDKNKTYDLDQLADEMKKDSKVIVRLEGHTDFRGSKKANYKLGKERVIAVKNYLLSKGVKEHSIKLKSLGGSKPITYDPEEKQKNRRVEVRILSK